MAAGAIVGMGLMMKAGSDFMSEAASHDVSVSKANALDQDATNSRRMADEATQDAAFNETRYRIMANRQIGQQKANFGASGVTNDGSVLDVLADSAATRERDALAIRLQGQRQAEGFNFQSRQDSEAANNLRLYGSPGAASTLLRMGGDFASGARAYPMVPGSGGGGNYGEGEVE